MAIKDPAWLLDKILELLRLGSARVQVEGTATVDDPVTTEASWTTLIDGVIFNNVTTSQDSADMDVTGYRGVWVLLDIDSASTPTDITFTPEISDDSGVTDWEYQEGVWASMVFEDTATASGVKKAFKLPLEGVDSWRIAVVATGTDATKTFTVTVLARGYR